jgi:hypothetical protein
LDAPLSCVGVLAGAEFDVVPFVATAAEPADFEWFGVVIVVSVASTRAAHSAGPSLEGSVHDGCVNKVVCALALGAKLGAVLLVEVALVLPKAFSGAINAPFAGRWLAADLAVARHVPPDLMAQYHHK